MSAVRVALAGEPALVEACSPDEGAALEIVSRDGGPELVVLFVRDPTDAGGFDCPVIAWCEGPAAIPVALGPADRLVLATGEHRRAWRRLPFPVADALYDLPLVEGGGWLVGDSPRRREYLAAHGHEPALLEPGAGNPLPRVAVDLRTEGRPSLRQPAVRALAAGRLLMSQPYEPSFGLEPGFDYVDAGSPEALYMAVEDALRTPAAYERTRMFGRRKAELFRASRVMSRLVHDLMLELEP